MIHNPYSHPRALVHTAVNALHVFTGVWSGERESECMHGTVSSEVTIPRRARWRRPARTRRAVGSIRASRPPARRWLARMHLWCWSGGTGGYRGRSSELRCMCDVRSGSGRTSYGTTAARAHAVTALAETREPYGLTEHRASIWLARVR